MHSSSGKGENSRNDSPAFAAAELQIGTTMPNHDTSSTVEEGQAFPDIFSSPSLDDFIPEDLSMELEPWSQQIAAESLGAAPVTAAGGAPGREPLSDVVSSSGPSSLPRQQPTAEETRSRKAQNQSEYRKRLKNKNKDTGESLQITANQIAAARNEQRSLQVQTSVLQKMVNYTEGAFYAAKGLLASAQQAVASLPACQVANNLLHLLLAKAIVPTDSQMRSMIKSYTFEQVEQQVTATQQQLRSMAEAWEKSPESRSIIEAHLALLQDARRRATSILLQERPHIMLLLIQSLAVPLGADGRPNQMLRTAIRDMNLTPEQVEGVHQQWITCRHDMREARIEAVEALNRIAGVCPPENQGIEDISASLAAGRFLETMEINKTLQDYPMKEGIALVRMVFWWTDSLTIIQKVRLTAACGQYLPDPLQMCTIMFDEDKPALEM